MRITYTIIPRYQCPTCGETRTGLLEVTGLFNQKLMCWACGAVALLKDCQPKKGQADHQGNNNAKPL